MHQSALALASSPLAHPLPGDATGFEIGWAHAHHGLVPPPELLVEGTAISQGWRAARAALGRRKPTSTRALRQWLALRCLAWRQGAEFDMAGLSPAALAGLEPRQCPVRRQPLGGPGEGADAPVVFRLEEGAGYRLGNVVVLSRAAAQAASALQDHPVSRALRQARAAEAAGGEVQGLDAAQWQRVAVLMSFTRHLPFHEAVHLPLVVWPPRGIGPKHAVQALQMALTQQFQQPGWSTRTRVLAGTLTQAAQRTDFHLFVSAFASRVLEASSNTVQGAKAGIGTGPKGAASTVALEDAWRNERVQRRWQQWVLGLGEAACEALLVRTRAMPGQAAPTGQAAAGQGTAAVGPATAHAQPKLRQNPAMAMGSQPAPSLGRRTGLSARAQQPHRTALPPT